jgi:hypothetical protein
MPPPLGSIWQFWHLRFVDEENRGRAYPIVAAKKQERKRKKVRECFILIQPFKKGGCCKIYIKVLDEFYESK